MDRLSSPKAALCALSRFVSLGVCVPRVNRPMNSSLLLESINVPGFTIGSKDKDLQERLSDAHRTIYEQYIISCYVMSLSARIDDCLKRKIERMLVGPDLEKDERDEDARSIQFELYVAAVLALGGAIINLGEPDLLLSLGDECVGVAVKRLRKHKKLMPRIKGAQDQIKKSGRRGFIAVNLDIFYRNLFPQAIGIDGCLSDFEQKITTILKLEDKLEYNPDVIGLLIFVTNLGWSFQSLCPMLNLFFLHRFIGFSNNPKEQAFYESFFEAKLTNYQNVLARL